MSAAHRVLRLRLIEAAAQLPGVRIGVDPEDQGRRAQGVAQTWYDWVMEETSEKEAAQPTEAPRRTLGLSKGRRNK